MQRVKSHPLSTEDEQKLSRPVGQLVFCISDLFGHPSWTKSHI